MSKYPEYIKECFKQFCLKMREIIIDIKELRTSYYEYIEYFGEKGVYNLVSLDKIALIFKNCIKIKLKNVGEVDEEFIESVVVMLKQMDIMELNMIKLIEMVQCKYNKDVVRFWQKINPSGWHGSFHDLNSCINFKRK